LLEGLEISVLNLSEVFNDNKTRRFDSEYFKKEFLKIDKNIISNDYNRLLSLCENITDFGAFSQNNFIEYKENGSHFFIRNQDIENSFIKNKKIFIEKDVYEKLSLKLNELDLLLQRTGSIGKSGLVLKKDLPSSANQNLAQIKPDLKKINPYFLNVFLNSLIGQKIFERLATGNVQPWLNLGQIESIKIPSLSEKIQLKIEELVKNSFNNLNHSKQNYTQAENILLEEIDL
jgi:restriction endonuclease S subunit